MIVRIQNANAALVAQPLGNYTGDYGGDGGSSSGGSGSGGSGGSGSGGSGGSRGNGNSNRNRMPLSGSSRASASLLQGLGVPVIKPRFGTGGYTGDWASNDGKLAILDKKELVLNKEDTKNFLDGIMILRQITSNLGGSIYAKVSRLKSNYFNTSSNDEIQQKVQISASFPNVNSKRQIEEAFNDLVNLAAQRAMRR